MGDLTIFRTASITTLPHLYRNVYGEVRKVSWDYGNTATTGSVYLLTSGALGLPEVISQVLGFSTDVNRYPTLEPENNAGTGIGSTSRIPYTVYGNMAVGGSGTGAETAGSYLSVEVHVWK